MRSLRCSHCLKQPINYSQTLKNGTRLYFCSSECANQCIESEIETEDRLLTTKYVNLNTYDIDKESLGTATWTLLHAIANNYPEKPEEYHKETVNDFLFYLSELYPCSVCRGDFQEMIDSKIINVSSKKALQNSLCNMHNVVNKKLDKNVVDCSEIKD